MSIELIGKNIGMLARILSGAFAFGFWQHDTLAGIAFAALLLTLET